MLGQTSRHELSAGNNGVNALTTFAHEKRKVIEIKRDVLRTRPRRLFNRKIERARHIFNDGIAPFGAMSPRLSAPDRDPVEVYDKERREMRQESGAELLKVRATGLVSVSQFVPRMIPSQKLDSPASALISSHGLNLQPHYPLSRDASSERAPAWLPRIEFPWRITFGAVVTFAVAVCFKTPEFQVVAAKKYVDRQSRIAP